MGNAISPMNLMKPSTAIKRTLENQVPPFLSTSDAAHMLGLSTTMVQTLWDQGELKGWKTRGGHRRIALESVNHYQNLTGLSVVNPARPVAKPRVMVVIESEQLRQPLQSAHLEWAAAVDLVFFESVSEAFLEMSNMRPHLLVMQMCSPCEQQEATVRVLENFNGRGHAPLSVVVVTEHKQRLLSLHGHAHAFIRLVSGPLSVHWLQAYLTGVLALCQN